MLPKLFKAWKISHLVFEKDTDAYGRDRDEEIKKLAKEAGVEVLAIPGRTLWDSDEIVKHNGGKPTMSATQLEHAAAKIGDPAKPLPAPKSIPDPGPTELDFDHEQPVAEPDLNSVHREEKDKSYLKLAGPKGDFAPPTLEELGMPAATTPHRGGETVALKMLDEIIKNKDYTAKFEKPKTAPTAFEPQSTTLLSPHHHFGSLSIREIYWRTREVVDNYKGASKPPASLIGQLIFRDMYFGAHAALGYTFGQTYNNSHCRFIPWHLPSIIDPETKHITGKYQVDSAEADTWYKRWKSGTTGFPWIDALMRQLKQEGWIHHLGRHAVACFLTRGGCYIDWERGAEVFEEWLIDHEPACNTGNWQWLSCTAFFSQFYRCYSPIAFPQKTDKNGDFVRRYCPELKNFDKKYIYEPWKAPIADQKKWGCLIKGDGTDTEVDGKPAYPKPMFDFPERRDICLSGMKKAYEVGLYGNDPKVLNGSWRELFDDDAEGPTKGSKGPAGAQLKDGEESHVDATGEEHDVHEQPPHGWTSHSKHERKASKEEGAGHKRKGSAGQSTLDGKVKRTKK